MSAQSLFVIFLLQCGTIDKTLLVIRTLRANNGNIADLCAF